MTTTLLFVFQSVDTERGRRGHDCNISCLIKILVFSFYFFLIFILRHRTPQTHLDVMENQTANRASTRKIATILPLLVEPSDTLVRLINLIVIQLEEVVRVSPFLGYVSHCYPCLCSTFIILENRSVWENANCIQSNNRTEFVF